MSSRPSRRFVRVAVAAVAVAALVGGGVAYAATGQPSIQTSRSRPRWAT